MNVRTDSKKMRMSRAIEREAAKDHTIEGEYLFYTILLLLYTSRVHVISHVVIRPLIMIIVVTRTRLKYTLNPMSVYVR